MMGDVEEAVDAVFCPDVDVELGLGDRSQSISHQHQHKYFKDRH